MNLNLRAAITLMVALSALSVLVSVAHAQTGLKWNEDSLSWTAPATCNDGAPIADCPVTGYRVETAKTCTATTWALAGSTAANVTTFKATNVTAGLNCYRVKATSATGDSAASNTASITTVAPVPGAPANLVVSDVTAYEIRLNTQGVYVASRLGLIPEGSICSSETRAVGGVTYNRVDPKSVDLFNVPAQMPPKDVFARCVAG